MRAVVYHSVTVKIILWIMFSLMLITAAFTAIYGQDAKWFLVVLLLLQAWMVWREIVTENSRPRKAHR